MPVANGEEPGAFSRAVEVLFDRGESVQDRWLAGSGLLIGGTSVLTAAHLLDGAGGGQVVVRSLDGEEYKAVASLIGDSDAGCDLAVVDIVDDQFGAGLPFVRFAQVDREQPTPISGCWAVGFPSFEYRLFPYGGSTAPRSQSAQIWGYVLPGSRLRGPRQLELMATHQPPIVYGRDESAWQGMSGSAVMVEGPDGARRVIGVVTEHTQPAGASVLAVTPIGALMELDEPQWWERFGPDALTDMGTVIRGITHDEPPDIFVDAIVRSARAAASDLQRGAELNDRHVTDSPGSGADRGGRR